ncbi:MAG: type IV toxin-antitoxin system AbiEi family antitoxin domain-containing protein [Verrucomicrobiae bacterium]|nr:type IV toxin-antitoxin system AbiEi family antitoxin domain-containing protein [Verrucomicrobiae bacterium]
MIKGSLAQFLKYIEDLCVAKKRDSFAALMSIAQDQQGFFATKQAIEAGYADNTHPYHVRTGNWERIWRGIYRLRHYPWPEDGDKVAWYLWSRGRDEKPVGVYSHETALSLFDLGDFNPADMHMTVPPTFRRNGPVPKGVVLHRGTVPAKEFTRLRGFAVCRPLRALVDLAKFHPTSVEDLRRVASEARRRGLITEQELEAKRKQCGTDLIEK